MSPYDRKYDYINKGDKTAGRERQERNNNNDSYKDIDKRYGGVPQQQVFYSLISSDQKRKSNRITTP